MHKMQLIILDVQLYTDAEMDARDNACAEGTSV